MIVGALFVIVLAVMLGGTLLLAERYLVDTGAGSDAAVAEIEQLLPRIQCAQCGYPGCRAYAQAIVEGAADINRCPPGGDPTLRRLALAIGVADPPVLDTSLGTASLDRIAVVQEPACVGCNLCARACPVDAIVGIPQMLHTVISTQCTGCELCLPVCPVDCIDMVPRSA
jgi:electron transport complex protein RnfB